MDIRNYLKQAPHEQFKQGCLSVVVYVLCAPAIMTLLMIFVGGVSLGTAGDGFQIFVLKLLAIVGFVILLAGILLPVVRMLMLSHKFSKQVARGDEHWIFYIGALLLILTSIFAYKPYIDSVTQNGSASSTAIVLFFTGAILGLLILFLAIFLLMRVSQKCYPRE